MVVISLTFLWTKIWSQRQRNKALYCNNTSTGLRFIDQQIHTQQPSQCNMCGCGASLNKYLQHGDVADAAADGGTGFFFSMLTTVCVFTAKAWRPTSCRFNFSRLMKTPKMRWGAERLETDFVIHWFSKTFTRKTCKIDTNEQATLLWVVCHSCGQLAVRTLRQEPAGLRGL